MREPAKDEAELIERISSSIPIWPLLAAIRAAGWAVVPVEPTESRDAICGCDGYFDEGCPACTPEVKP